MFNACTPEDEGVTGLYIIDKDSSLRPKTSSFAGTSAIIGNIGSMSSFIDTNKCITSPAYKCSLYCEDTCLRTVTYTVDPSGTEDYTLKICSIDSGVCAESSGTYYYDEEDTPDETLMRNTRSDRYRYFDTTLPAGTYTAEFFDGNGTATRPSFVYETFETPLCNHTVQEGSITLQSLPVDALECNDLIRNGDAEASSNEPLFWLHRKGGIRLITNEGRNGSNAFGDIERTDAGMDSISEYLDTRCMRSGSLYEIKAWAKLVNPTTGTTHYCDYNSEKCPEVGLIAYESPGRSLWQREPVATTVSSSEAREYQLIHGLFEINDEMANANSVLFYVERNMEDLAMLIDDVSMTEVTQTDATYCDDLFHNGRFSDGDTRFWTEYNTNRPFEVVSPGVGGSSDFALKTFDGSPRTYLKTGCLELDERYALTAQFKILDGDGNEFACDIESPTSSTECPTMRLKPVLGSESPTRTISRTIGIPTNTSWNTMYGIFSAKTLYSNAESIRLTFVSTVHDFLRI